MAEGLPSSGREAPKLQCLNAIEEQEELGFSNEKLLRLLAGLGVRGLRVIDTVFINSQQGVCKTLISTNSNGYLMVRELSADSVDDVLKLFYLKMLTAEEREAVLNSSTPLKDQILVAYHD